MIRGFVEVLNNREARGYAFSTDDAQEVLSVEGHVSAMLRGGTLANLTGDTAPGEEDYRDRGFIIIFDPPLTDSERVGVEIYARRPTGESVALPRWLAHPRGIGGHRRRLSPPPLRTDPTQWPVFVLGAARSGTTAIAQALLTIPKYDGAAEDHLLELYHTLLAAVRSQYARIEEARALYPEIDHKAVSNIMIDWVPEEFFINAIRETFINLVQQVFDGPHWMVKTPNSATISACPFFREIWPNARFIFMKRRGIENISSRARKFHVESFSSHCSAWAGAMDTWAKARPRLAGAAIEIDQRALARDPRRAAAVIAEFLGLDSAEMEHLAYALRRRPEQTSEVFGALCRPEDLGWSEQQWKMFSDTCGPMMEMFGYSMDERYYLSESPYTGLTIL